MKAGFEVCRAFDQDATDDVTFLHDKGSDRNKGGGVLMEIPKLDGKRVVIIGGSSGVGFAVAQCAIADGARVVIGSSSVSRVEDAVKRLGAQAQGAPANVKESESLTAFFQASGPFDHLVFTAGDAGPALTPHGIAEVDFSTAGAVFDVRFWGALRAIQCAAPYLASTGSITLTDGIMGHRPRKGLFLAAATSGAIEHLVQGLAVELAPRRVNTVCLGFTLTEDHASRMSAEQIAQATSKQLLERAGLAVEVAQAYLYCMRGSYTTGQTIIADGGRLLG